MRSKKPLTVSISRHTNIQKGKRKNLKKTYFLIAVLIPLFNACTKMAGYKADYHTYSQNEIKHIIADKTVRYGHQKIYFTKDGHYFRLNPAKNTPYDKGKWYTKSQAIETYNGKHYSLAYLCMQSSLYHYNVCRSVFKNGGKIYFDRFDMPSLKFSQGKTALKKQLLSEDDNISILSAYENMFGKDAEITKHRQKIIAEREKERKERERLAQLRRKEERERQARLATQRSYSSKSYGGSSTISICVPSIPRPIEYSQCTISSGGFYATVKLSRGGGMSSSNCYDLNIYHSGSIAVANTCGGVNGSWSYNVNGSSGFANGITQTISQMIQQMR